MSVAKPLRYEKGDRLADHLASRIAEELLCREVEVGDVAAVVRRHDGVLRTLRHRPELLFARAESLLRLLALDQGADLGSDRRNDVEEPLVLLPCVHDEELQD